MKQVLLFCFTRTLTLYVKGLALAGAAVLWPVNVLMISRLSETTSAPKQGRSGSAAEQLVTPHDMPPEPAGARLETWPEAPVLVGFSV